MVGKTADAYHRVLFHSIQIKPKNRKVTTCEREKRQVMKDQERERGYKGRFRDMSLSVVDNVGRLEETSGRQGDRGPRLSCGRHPLMYGAV